MYQRRLILISLELIMIIFAVYLIPEEKEVIPIKEPDHPTIFFSDNSFPIAQGIDNSYYLDHNIEGQEYIKGNAFFDYRNDLQNDDHLILYGHSTTKEDQLFTFLRNYYQKDYYEDHSDFLLFLNDKYDTYEIMGIKEISAQDPSFSVWEHISFPSLKDKISFFQEYIKELDVVYRSDYHSPGNFMTLVTCNMKDTSKRYLVFAQKVLS